MSVWLDQGGCVILKHDNMLLGFCKGEEVDFYGIITFFHPSKEDVDNVYCRLEDIAESPPKDNPKYRIYHFYARDPEGRRLEVQCFLHPLEPYADGKELLESRRSIRRYSRMEVGDDILRKILSDCVHAPSSRNLQPCRFIVIRDREKLEYLASLRGESSAPIASAPLAVAVVSDTTISSRPEQDGCIMAYHFLLAAWMHGLGTCWIAAMDRDEAKKNLGIPIEHYIATITPLGYPAESPNAPCRKEVKVERRG